MLKFFKLVEGNKFYCDEKGVIAKDAEGEAQAVPATDTEAVDVEAGVDEATKMLNAAMEKARMAGSEQMEKTVEAFDTWMKSIEARATEKAAPVAVDKEVKGFDVKALVESVQSKVGKSQKGSHTITLTEKDVQAITKSTSRTDLTGDVIEVDRDTDITRDPQRQVFMEQIANTVETNSDKLEWVEVVTETGAPATTAELAAIPQKDYTFQTFRASLEKIAVINKHSVELLKYGPELVAAIRRMLQVDLNLVTDAQLLSGNGTTPNLQGILGVAPVLDGAAIGAQRVADANLFDVLRIAATKVAVVGKGAFVPNYVVLHPDDTEKFDLTKDVNGDYIMPPFYDAAGRRVRGARIIENTGIASGTFLVGDFRYMHVRTNGGVEIEMTNSDGTDFQNDILSIKMRRFLGAYTKANENGAFITGDISTVIAALVAA